MANPFQDKTAIVTGAASGIGLAVSRGRIARGAKVVLADLIYTPNGGHRDEEWLRVSARLVGDDKVVADLPGDATHYFVNLVDENNFLRSYPEMTDGKKPAKRKRTFTERALKAE